MPAGFRPKAQAEGDRASGLRLRCAGNERHGNAEATSSNHSRFHLDVRHISQPAHSRTEFPLEAAPRYSLDLQLKVAAASSFFIAVLPTDTSAGFPNNVKSTCRSGKTSYLVCGGACSKISKRSRSRLESTNMANRYTSHCLNIILQNNH